MVCAVVIGRPIDAAALSPVRHRSFGSVEVGTLGSPPQRGGRPSVSFHGDGYVL